MQYKILIACLLIGFYLISSGCGAGLVRLVGNRLVIAQEVHFASNSDEILPESNGLLDEIARFIIAKGPRIAALRLIGHTDLVGAEEANLSLSERRAAAVMTALQSRGVTQSVQSEGRGEAEPLCNEETDECNARNRRVEMLVESTPVFPGPPR